MDRAAIAGGVPVRSDSAISAAGPRQDLRRCLPQTSPGHEDRGSVVGSAIALAARLRRAGDWLHTARMPGPCDRLPRSRSTPDAVPVFFLLSRNAPAPFVGKGLTGATGS